ncbi:MAG: hypothetical protein KatS3mg112_0062 [Thermogutta sp.]|nr:MAG: hypothetical protein KatS3mg112_0062 [Thermogutta sp.]
MNCPYQNLIGPVFSLFAPGEHPKPRQWVGSDINLGGTCLSGPLFDIGSSIPISSGTTSVPLRRTCRTNRLVRSTFQRLENPLHRAGSRARFGRRVNGRGNS